MKRSTLLGLTAVLVLGTLMGCSAATDNKTTTPTVTSSPRAYVLSWTGTTAIWPNVSFGVKPLSGKAITDVGITYAGNAAALTGLGVEWHSKVTDAAEVWHGNVASGGVATTSDTWVTTSVSGAKYTIAATDNVSIKLWNNAGTESKLSVKQVVLTYGDNSTETLTFTSDGSAPVQAVYQGATTNSTVASRFWTYIDNSLTLTPSFAALN